MTRENEKQVKKVLQRTNKTWNYLYETLERFNENKKYSEIEKEYITYTWQKLREIKMFLVNVKYLIADEDQLPESLERQLMKRLNNKNEQMIKIIIQLDKIF